MSQHQLRIEPFHDTFPHRRDGWCVREFIRSDDNLYHHKRVLPGSLYPTRRETADWYAEYLRERREP